MGKALCVRDNFTCEQCFTNVLDKFLLVPFKGLGRATKDFASRNTLFFHCGQETGEYGFCNHGQRHTKIQGTLACPFPCSLLTSGIKNHIYHWLASLFIILGEDIGCNLDQIAVEFTFVPFCENFMKFLRVKVQRIFQQMISFTDQLHVTIFDAVVYHFHIVSGTVRSDICTTRVTVHFGRNRRKDRFNQFISTFLSTWHNRRSVQSAFFTA
ncbi:hypothetical protein D3C81_1488690 [compost metagenome]